MFVYCISTVEEPTLTYVGATVNLERRLAQHNRLYSGGARATGVRLGGWYRICYVKGFIGWREALSFEWHWKFFSRKYGKGCSLTKRQMGLDKTLAWASTTCISGLEVVYE